MRSVVVIVVVATVSFLQLLSTTTNNNVSSSLSLFCHGYTLIATTTKARRRTRAFGNYYDSSAAVASVGTRFNKNQFRTPQQHLHQSMNEDNSNTSDNNSDSNSATNQVTKLKQLGFTEKEFETSQPPREQPREQPNVRVNLLPEVDAITLTAIGFTLIGVNFFILANLGDGGIAGMVASIINLSRQ